MSTWDGKDIIEDVPVDVPADLAGSIVQLEVTAGDSAKLDAAPPVDLPSLLAAFRKLLPGNVWAVTLYPADEGVALDGKLVRDLPPSAQDKLRPQIAHAARASRTSRSRARSRPPSASSTAPRSMLVRVRAARSNVDRFRSLDRSGGFVNAATRLSICRRPAVGASRCPRAPS